MEVFTCDVTQYTGRKKVPLLDTGGGVRLSRSHSVAYTTGTQTKRAPHTPPSRTRGAGRRLDREGARGGQGPRRANLQESPS